MALNQHYQARFGRTPIPSQRFDRLPRPLGNSLPLRWPDGSSRGPSGASAARSAQSGWISFMSARSPVDVLRRVTGVEVEPREDDHGEVVEAVESLRLHSRGVSQGNPRAMVPRARIMGRLPPSERASLLARAAAPLLFEARCPTRVAITPWAPPSRRRTDSRPTDPSLKPPPDSPPPPTGAPEQTPTDADRICRALNELPAGTPHRGRRAR